MQAVEERAETLQDHVASTYMNVRIGIGVIGGALPLILSISSFFTSPAELLGSMSAYYYSPLRDVFVGSLIAIGVFLYLYKGFSTLENWLLNAAGLFAVIVATVATTAPRSEEGWNTRIHAGAAIAFFLCIGAVSIVCATDTLSLITDESRKGMFARVYRILGIGMIVAPIVAVVINYLLDPGSRAVFWVEAFGVWVFSVYWLVKSYELRETQAERQVLSGDLKAGDDRKRGSANGRLVRAK